MSEPDPNCASVPIGFWTFDDCNDFRTDLFDSSPQGHPAFRSVDAACTAGQENLAIAFDSSDDLVYAPDQPDFALDQGVTVAAWLKPDRVDGVQSVFRKRDDGNSAFGLLINGRKFQFIVRLAAGGLAAVSAPARAGVWTHVAATYDRTDLRLYVNGVEVGRSYAPGQIARGVGPLLMGNDASQRRFAGVMDNAWFNTQAAPADAIARLMCLHKDVLVSLSPATSGPVAAGTSVTYTLSITNQNDAICDAESFFSFINVPPELTSEPNFVFTNPVASGMTIEQPLVVRSGEETEAGSYVFSTQVQRNGFIGPVPLPAPPPGGPTMEPPVIPGFAQAEYVVQEPTGCHVASQRELMIRHVSVVDDPVRTVLDGGPADDPRTGAWSFGRLMQRLSPNDAAAPDVTEAMFRTSLSPQTINGFSVATREPMETLVLAPWPRSADGKLDLARAPMRLLAITHRLDLSDMGHGKAGEGRLTYGVLDPQGFPLQFTVIFEYTLPAANQAEARAWVDTVHALQTLPFPSEEYNQALQAITDRFSARGALPGAPNDSALIDIRTNEIALSLDGQWQLREFHISAETGFMVPAPVFLTPDASFNGSEALARFINANEATILTETHEVPLSFEGAPFLAGAIFNNIDFWSAPGITNPEARHKFSLNTCNGCHGAETNTIFLQINPRLPGQASVLSGFLNGEDVFDPISGEMRRLSELARRRKLLEAQVCPTTAP